MININKNDSLTSLKVYEPKRKIKYIAISKTWHDAINGNTYFSSNIEDIERDVNYLIPFQYGYGNQSEYTNKNTLDFINQEEIKFIKIEGCTKKEVEQHGKGLEDNYFSALGYYYQD